MSGADYNEGYLDGRDGRRTDLKRSREYRRGYVAGKRDRELAADLADPRLGDGNNAFRRDFEQD